MSNDRPTPSSDLTQIIESAERMGVEMDEAEALQWLTAMAARTDDDDIVVDTRTGVFGHSITMLDFSDDDLAHFREIGRLVEIEDEPGVETALALSGSSAQSKIQSYPGDCDYFERVNIQAESRQEACQILARVIRQKALDKLEGPTYRLMDVRFGQYPETVIRGDETQQAGSSIVWGPEEIEAGQFQAQRPNGEPLTITWDDVAGEPGWCKIDWVIADAIRANLANASNMLDATWEAPDGTITPLDGYLDPYFQEVYLDANSVPIFAKLARHVSADALDEYVKQLEKEVGKYVGPEANYGKAAKRMYNIFRFTGRYEEAAFLRELFDEPATVLYQVGSLIRALDEALAAGGGEAMEAVHRQADQLVLNVVEALEGEEETAIVRQLLRLRQVLSAYEVDPAAWKKEVEVVRDAVSNLVNNFFYEKLTAVPTIKHYIAQFTSDEES